MYLYMYVPQKKEKIERCVRKKWQNKMKEWKRHTKGAGVKFCAHQYLYSSEYLGLGLGLKLYLPPLEWLGSSGGTISLKGSLISSVEGLLLCLDGGCGIGSNAVSVSVLGSNSCSEISFCARLVVVSMSRLWPFDLGFESCGTDGSEKGRVSRVWPPLESWKQERGTITVSGPCV